MKPTLTILNLLAAAVDRLLSIAFAAALMVLIFGWMPLAAITEAEKDRGSRSEDRGGVELPSGRGGIDAPGVWPDGFAAELVKNFPN